VPKTIVAQLNTVIVRRGQSSELRTAFAKQGLDPQMDTPEQFGEFIRSEIAKNVKLVKAAGLKPE